MTDDEKLLKFLMKHRKEQKKPEKIHGSARGLLGTSFFETSPEKKRAKKQRIFEENTFENFKVIQEEILETIQLLREFYERSEGEIIEKEKLQQILADSEKLINEMLSKEQKIIDKLKERLIDVIKEYDSETKQYKRKRRMLEKWIPRFVKAYNDSIDASRKYEKEIIENNRLTRLLVEKVNEYNDKILKINEGR